MSKIGKKQIKIPSEVTVKIGAGIIEVHGKGGVLKVLLIQGVGYRAVLEGNTLLLNVGFSHPIKFKIPEDIKISVDKNTIIKVSGINKNQVGQVAANIRTIKKPEPYKGKGIRYKDEIVVKKEIG